MNESEVIEVIDAATKKAVRAVFEAATARADRIKRVSHVTELNAALEQDVIKHVHWCGQGNLAGLEITVPPGKSLRIDEGCGIDFSDGSRLTIHGDFYAPPHAHVFRNPKVVSNHDGLPSVGGSFDGIDRYLGWWLDPDENNATIALQCAVSSIFWDKRKYVHPPIDWRWSNGGTTVTYRACSIIVPARAMVITETINLRNYVGEIRGQVGATSAFSFEGLKNNICFDALAVTPHLALRNLYLRVAADCPPDTALIEYGHGFQEPGMIEGTMVNMEVPGDIVRCTGVGGSGIHHIECRGNVWGFDDTIEGFVGGKHFNLGGYSSKILLQANSFIRGDIGVDLQSRSLGVTAINNHWETQSDCVYNLRGSSSGYVGGVVIKGDTLGEFSEPARFVDIPEPKWAGALDISATLYRQQNRSLFQFVRDARHNGTKRIGGTTDLPATGFPESRGFSGIFSHHYKATAGGYELW